MTRRTERIGEQLRAVLAQLLREELADPRLAPLTITLTRVDVAPDLSQALVYWSAFDRKAEGPDDAASAERIDGAGEALAHAAAFLRRRLSQEVDLRRVPALEFRRDASLELGARTLDLIRRVNDGE
ncbi:MAG: 30S ribosome-binding factor RbfA [Myxococcota bacterium]|nr:30S ribosome-binding factor RbfA [Myxococcales bacterium]